MVLTAAGRNSFRPRSFFRHLNGGIGSGAVGGDHGPDLELTSFRSAPGAATLGPMLVLVAALVALGLAGPPQGRDAAPPRTIPELEARIREVLARAHVPGIGIAVVTRDSVIWVAGLGTADVASNRPATPETLFRIGSTSKAFVSLLVLMLERAGKLRLDDPVRQHAPEIAFRNPWEATDPVRIVNLLEHTTGWDDFSPRDYASDDSAPALTLRQGLALTPRTRTSRWRPGTRQAYCNSGPAVAAYIVQKIEGRPFETLVHDRLFAPIGMTTATYFRPQPSTLLATGYHRDGKTPFPYWYLIERPAGAINASPKDMAAYVRFLLSRGSVNGHEIVPAAAIVRMEHPETGLTAGAGLPVGYGLSLATYVADTGLEWVGHDGSVPGGLTTMAYRPEQGVGFAFMINSDNVDAERQIDRLVRGFLVQGALRPPLPDPAPLSALARERTGWYIVDNPRNQHLYFLERLLALARVGVDGNALTFTPLLGPSKRYLPVTAILFRIADQPVATLALVSDSLDGRPAAIERMAYLLPISYRRIATPLVWAQLIALVAFALTCTGSLFFGVLWVPRFVFGRLSDPRNLGVRGWPLVAAVTLLSTVILLAASPEDSFTSFGDATVWSVGLLICTLVFPLAAGLGLVVAWRAAGVRGLRYYGLAASVVNVGAAAYLAWWGLIGWRSWG